MLLSPEPLSVIVLAKITSHWLVSGLPLVLLSPLIGLQFGLAGDALSALFYSLLIGTPVLSLIGAIGAALTLGARNGGVLVSLLVLPLYIPVLIFGADAVATQITGNGGSAQLMLLGAMLASAVALAPWATAAALRVSVE